MRKIGERIYALIAASGLYIIDISDPYNPTLVCNIVTDVNND